MSRHTQLFGIAEQGGHLLRVDRSVNLGIVGESTPGSIFTDTNLNQIPFGQSVSLFLGTGAWCLPDRTYSIYEHTVSHDDIVNKI